MSRPIKKSWFGDPAQAGSQLRFIAKLNGGAAQNSYVKSQKGTRKYKLADTATGLVITDCYLVNKASGSLLLGEASMTVTPYTGTGSTAYASKITQKRVYTYASTTVGGVTAGTVTAGGTTYSNGTSTVTPTGGSGTGATLSITVAGGIIQSATVVSAGINYAPSDILTIPGGDGAGRFTVSAVYGDPASYIWKASASVAGEATVVLA